MKKIIAFILVVVISMSMLTGCVEYVETDVDRQQEVTKDLEKAQPTPTDIDYSLERYNGIRRAYWVNGMREKARTLPCPVEKPLGYIILMLDGVGVVGQYVVDGKVSSLNSYLTPDSIDEYYANGGVLSKELADVDGSYGENDNGIYFFTPEGKYMEWTGTYLYSDIPHIVESPILKIQDIE